MGEKKEIERKKEEALGRWPCCVRAMFNSSNVEVYGAARWGEVREGAGVEPH